MTTDSKAPGSGMTSHINSAAIALSTFTTDNQALASTHRAKVLPVQLVLFDPENPRDLTLTEHHLKAVGDQIEWDCEDLYEQATDVFRAVHADTADLELLTEEFVSILSLATTLPTPASLGQPIIVHEARLEEGGIAFQLIAGERRLLAHHLRGHDVIKAVIREVPKSTFQRRLLQYVENEQKESLCLRDKIKNIDAIVTAWQIDPDANQGRSMSSRVLAKLLGVSHVQANKYLLVLRNPQMLESVESRRVTNLDEAIRQMDNSKPGSDEPSKIPNRGQRQSSAKVRVKLDAKDMAQCSRVRRVLIALGSIPEFAQTLSAFDLSDASQLPKALEQVLNLIVEPDGAAEVLE